MKQNKIFIYYVSDAIRHDTDENGIKISRVKLTRPNNLKDHKLKKGEIIYGLSNNNVFPSTFEIINKLSEYYDIKLSNGLQKLYNFEKYENEEFANRIKNSMRKVLDILGEQYNNKLDLTKQYDTEHSLCTFFDISKMLIEDVEKKEVAESYACKITKNIIEETIKKESYILITKNDIEVEFYKANYEEEYVDKDEYIKTKKIIIKEREGAIYRIYVRLPIYKNKE